MITTEYRKAIIGKQIKGWIQFKELETMRQGEGKKRIKHCSQNSRICKCYQVLGEASSFAHDDFKIAKGYPNALSSGDFDMKLMLSWHINLLWLIVIKSAGRDDFTYDNNKTNPLGCQNVRLLNTRNWDSQAAQEMATHCYWLTQKGEYILK